MAINFQAPQIRTAICALKPHDCQHCSIMASIWQEQLKRNTCVTYHNSSGQRPDLQHGMTACIRGLWLGGLTNPSYSESGCTLQAVTSFATCHPPSKSVYCKLAELSYVCLQEMIEVHRGREDSKAKAQASAKASSLVECQPNTGAPLLRDEKARRDWVERELDICCQVTPHLFPSLTA